MVKVYYTYFSKTGESFKKPYYPKPPYERTLSLFSTASTKKSYYLKNSRQRLSKKPQLLYHLFENSHVNGIVIRLVIDFNQIYTPFHLRNSHYVGDDSGSS